jgi:hypothetical protein
VAAYIDVDEPVPELRGANLAELVLLGASAEPGSVEFTLHIHDHERLVADIVLRLRHFVLLINYNKQNQTFFHQREPPVCLDE